MNLDIRQAVLANLTNSSAEDIMSTINDSVSKEDKVLPGLGVLFEAFWKGASADDKSYICEAIAKNIKQ